MRAPLLASVLIVAAALAGAAALANQNDDRREREDRNDHGGPETTKTVRSIPVASEVSESGQILITSVIVIANTGDVLGVLTDSGIRRVDENRVDLSGVPLIGGLFGGGGDDDDEGGPARPIRIGTAFLIGNTLAVDAGAPPTTGSSAPPATTDEVEIKSAAIEARIAEVSNATSGSSGIAFAWDGAFLELDSFTLLNRSYSYNAKASQFVKVGSVVEAPDESDAGDGRVPMLGDIPLLASLFGQKLGDAYLERRDLMVLIKPSILEDDYE